MASKDLDRELLAALLATPEDLEVRLVYADRLIERGDPRGELISAQCRLARMRLHDPERPALARRCDRLQKQLGPQIAERVSELTSEHRFRGGFIDTVAMTGSAWRVQCDELLASHPITTLVIRPYENTTTKGLGASIAKVRRLEVHGNLGATPRTLFASRHIAQLEHLDIQHADSRWSDTLADLVAPRLRSIRIGWSNNSATSLIASLATRELPALRHAAIVYSELEDGALAAWLDRAEDLETLHLQHTPGVTDDLVPALLKLPKLRRLDVSATAISATGLITLLGGRLERLVAFHCREARVLAAAARLPADHPLRELSLAPERNRDHAAYRRFGSSSHDPHQVPGAKTLDAYCDEFTGR